MAEQYTTRDQTKEGLTRLKGYTDTELAKKQNTLVSGTNIKTINNQSILGSGNLTIEGGTVTGFVATYGVTTAQEIIAYLESGAPMPMFVERSGSYYTVTTAAKQDTNRVIIRTFATLSGEYYMFTYDITDDVWANGNYGLQQKLVSGTNIKTVNGETLLGDGNIQIGGSGTVDDELSGTSLNPVQNRVLYGIFDSMRQVVETLQTDVAGNTAAIAGKQDAPEYELSIEGTGGNVERIGSITIDGTKYGLFQFFYKTGALPNTNTKDYNLSALLTGYSVKDFIDATGITSNGIFIGNGRTDGTNRVIVQQFSKNNKTVTIRTYQDFSTNTATLKIQFIGTKNS